MTRIVHRSSLLCLALATLFAPVATRAQDMGHMQMPMPSPATTEQKKPAKKTPSADMQMSTPMLAPAQTEKKKPAKKAPSPHGQHDHQAVARPPAEAAPSQPAPRSSGHEEMPAMTMPMGAPEKTSSPQEPRTPIPVLTDADRAAAAPPPSDHPVHDNTVQSYTVFDRLEGWNADAGTGAEWEGESWIGTDRNRLWLRTEGERRDSRTEEADLEVLYGHSVSTWWDVVAGLRHDFKPGDSQDFAAIGVMGLAPYKFEVAATAYVGQSGQTAARFEAQYETLFTNRLILQPLAEANFYGQDDARRGIGSGLSSVEAGLRLRYEITRRFAPYIGLVYERAFGRTADLRRAEGEDDSETRLVAGIRIWF